MLGRFLVKKNYIFTLCEYTQLPESIVCCQKCDHIEAVCMHLNRYADTLVRKDTPLHNWFWFVSGTIVCICRLN